MKKLAAFFTACILFLGIIFGVHFMTRGGLAANNPAFGMWINSYKYNSYEAMSENQDENTILYLGSSEFNHGKGTPYHPKNVFLGQDMHPMIIGTAYTQSLYHAITVAALEPTMKNRKVAIILSPQWFDSEGVKPEAYATRFSESNYIAMLENPKISKDIKERIAKRSEKLLKKDPAMYKRVKGYNKIFLKDTANINDYLYFLFRDAFISEKDRLTVMTAMKTSGIKNMTGKEKLSGKPLDWEALYAKAEQDGSKNSKPENFYIMDKYYNKNIKDKRAKLADYQKSKSFNDSPEYGDLKILLDICKERNIKIMIVMIPVNGYWYDYTGFPKDRREQYYQNIRDIAAEYNVELADFSAEEYTPHFMEDTIHIGWKGWVRTNETVYEFYKKM